MPVNRPAYHLLHAELTAKAVQLVAVSKTKPVSDILALYDLGQRDFGENYVQELVEKQAQLPGDIRWHFIGHLQSNKVKHIAPFIHLIHGIDSVKLLQAVNKEAIKNGRVIHVLLQIHIAREDSKFGFNEAELAACLDELQRQPLDHVCIAGFMGMASFIQEEQQVRHEFQSLRSLAEKYKDAVRLCNSGHSIPSFIISMGMSGDYQWAIAEGSNMVRVGSLLFGTRG